MIQREERLQQVVAIKKYFMEDLRSHGGYAINFFLCELAALINVIGQIYFTDKFLGYQFSTVSFERLSNENSSMSLYIQYGWDVLAVTAMDPESRYDPMNALFPKVSKCTFHAYGPSGTITKFDSICILALNIINEKIFVFLWFWFVLLAIISTLALIYRIAILSVPSLRVRVIMRKLHNRVNQRIVEDVLSCQNHSWIDQIGDYWVFFLLSKNLPTIAMKELLEDLKPIFNSSTPNGYSKLEKD